MKIERKTIITLDTTDELMLFKGMAAIADNAIKNSIKNRHKILDIDTDCLRDISTFAQSLATYSEY